MNQPELEPNKVWRVECSGKEYLVLIVEKAPTMKMSTQGLVRSRLPHGDVEALGEMGARRNMRWLMNYEWKGTMTDYRYFDRNVFHKAVRSPTRKTVPIRFIERVSDI